MRENLERRLVSPTKKIFGRGWEPQGFKLVGLNEATERVGMLFLESGTLLPLGFWRLGEALRLLSKRTGMVRLGQDHAAEGPQGEAGLRQQAEDVCHGEHPGRLFSCLGQPERPFFFLPDAHGPLVSQHESVDSEGGVPKNVPKLVGGHLLQLG